MCELRVWGGSAGWRLASQIIQTPNGKKWGLYLQVTHRHVTGTVHMTVCASASLPCIEQP
jgi:hypothetical protein